MTDSTDTRSRTLILLTLAALMAATRGQYFAPLGHHLPDASVAVFLLGGFYLGRLGGFALLLGLAALIDVTAVGWGGVSAYCLTPAYGMLLPAYGSAWFFGHWYAGHHRHTSATIPRLLGTVLAAGLVAETFASGGFYLLSGRFAEPSLIGLAHSLVDYLPETILALVLYTGMAALIHLSLTAAQPDLTREADHR